MLQHPRFAPRHGDRQRPAIGHAKFDDVGAASLRTLDHDPVLAGYRLFFLPPFLTPSVVTAAPAALRLRRRGPYPRQTASPIFVERTEMNVACQNCGRVLKPCRSTARYCGGACRVAAQRKRDRGLAVERPRKLVGGLSRAFLALQAPSTIARGQNVADVTLTRFPKLDPRIVLDAKWPSMYRIRLPDGGLSDMLNLTRAKDALALS